MVFVAYVHNTDTGNAMSKGSKGLKDYVMLKQRTYTSLCVKGVESYFDFQLL